MLRNLKCCSGNSLTVIVYEGSDQTARMRRLNCAFAGRTYHIVGNLMSGLIIMEVNEGLGKRVCLFSQYM